MKNKIITFYLNDDNVLNFAPKPTPKFKALPYWYKRQEATSEAHENLANGIVATTIKKCMPIFDAMSAGYVLYAPCDIFIDSTDPEKLIYSIPADIKKGLPSLFAKHAREQYSDYPIEADLYHKDVLRIHGLWSIGTEKGYSSLFMDPIHKDPNPLKAFAGIIDTDNFLSDGHFSMLIRKDFQGIIKQGTPLIQILPFKRDAWEMKMKSADESLKVHNKQRLELRSTFSNGYKNKFRVGKEYR